MTGFFWQNTIATGLSLLAGISYYFLYPDSDQIILVTVAACAFLGVHLPNIQQPTHPSYRLIRGASWIGSFLVPMGIFFYRPTDFILAWIIAILFINSFWIIIDRISLQRDYTRSPVGIVFLPLIVAGSAYLALGESVLLPVFIATNCGYISFLILESLISEKLIKQKTHSATSNTAGNTTAS
ncbi:MAG: hypothetical protein ACPGSM_11950 [Thiolinea sp.]